MLTTPDSCISSQRSLPSRVRSPTPANTEKPPCCLATLLMSSMMTTVLPTPAAPNRPLFPPLREGRDEVCDLHPGLEHLGSSRLLVEPRRQPVDGQLFLRADGAEQVDRL